MTHKTECHMEQIAEGVVKCARCGREVKSKFPPEKVHAPCRSDKSIGVGDTIAKITRATGLDKVARGVTKAAGKKGCGCGKRQRKYNDRWKYNNKSD